MERRIITTVSAWPELARELLTKIQPTATAATCVALSGDLGVGKTTLVQALGQTLGIKDAITSPTFVIQKTYPVTQSGWDQLVHIDAYRLEDVDELRVLAWSQTVTSPRTLVCIEWAERIQGALPPQTWQLTLSIKANGQRLVEIMPPEGNTTI